MLLPKCAVSDGTKSRFITEQEAEWLISMIGKIPIFSKLLI